MTDNMIERVARALCRVNNLESRSRAGINVMYDSDWLHYENASWKNHENEARAAIAAMRDPTEAVVTAGLANVDASSDLVTLGYIDGDDLTPAWRAMIDAALGEKP